MELGQDGENKKQWKQIIEDHCKKLYGADAQEDKAMKAIHLHCLCQAEKREATGDPPVYPSINDILDTRALLICNKASGAQDNLVAEMLKALSPVHVYVIA